ncbi:MAG: hypothetical protein J0L52_12835 [Caulobacterales bacterium]|nr:hypothetical protein [Caulobacterales bacterium]
MAVDRTDIGTVVDALYACISGPAGPRDWDTQRLIFHPDSRQARTGLGADGTPWIKIMGREDYVEDVTPFFVSNAFYEVETARRVDVFGNMAHVWSVYEAKTHPDDALPERRGINSIQLYRDADGNWSVLHMIWDNERPGLTVPSAL